MPNTWTDYRGAVVPENAIVLDDKGDCWQVTDDGGYGRTNAAKCNGVEYTRGAGVAVRIGLSFLLSARGDLQACPQSRKAGMELYNRWFSRHVEPRVREELSGRKWRGHGV